MHKFRLKITKNDLAALKDLTQKDLPKEAGAFALAGVARHGGVVDVIVRRPVPLPAVDFVVQNQHRLVISSRAINGLISLCEKNGMGAVVCHSHPEDIPYSPSDDFGERQISEVLARFVPSGVPMTSLLFCPGEIRGRVWLSGQRSPIPISDIIILGSRVQHMRAGAGSVRLSGEMAQAYDRQIRAFGLQGQMLIAQAKIGVVGVGGTGSPTAEQVVRLGVRDLLLIDPDIHSSSNITRVYGTVAAAKKSRHRRAQINAPRKVDIIARHLQAINPLATIRAVDSNVVCHEAATALLDRDVIFLCTDDHWGRSVVNQVAYQYFVPTINVGVRIAAPDGRISAAVGVIDVLRPDLPCLWCRQFLRSERIRAESLPRRERKALAREGYVEGLDTPTPAVISLTTTISGLAVTEFIQLTTGFRGDSAGISRLNYDALEATMRRGSAQIAASCVCKQMRGVGDLRPLPTQADVNCLND